MQDSAASTTAAVSPVFSWRKSWHAEGGGNQVPESGEVAHLWSCGVIVCLRRHLLGSGPSHGLPAWGSHQKHFFFFFFHEQMPSPTPPIVAYDHYREVFVISLADPPLERLMEVS